MDKLIPVIQVTNNIIISMIVRSIHYFYYEVIFLVLVLINQCIFPLQLVLYSGQIGDKA
jgi:hypothetical protein